MGLATCSGSGIAWQFEPPFCESVMAGFECPLCLPNGNVVDCSGVMSGTKLDEGTPCTGDAVCVPLEGCRARVCQPGATRCNEQGGLERCDPRGVAWLLESPACAHLPCVHCAAAGKSVTCAANGSTSSATCAAGQACVTGQGCTLLDCQPGSLTCDDTGSFLQCGADGFGEIPLTCGGYGDCADGPDGSGCRCDDGPGCVALTGCVPSPADSADQRLRVNFQNGESALSGQRFIHLAPVVVPSTGEAIEGLQAGGTPSGQGVFLLEDGQERALTCKHLIFSPDARLDLLLVVDVTSSMSPVLESLRAGLLHMAVALGQAGLKIRYGLLPFSDLAAVYSPVPLSEDIYPVDVALGAWTTVTGGDPPESGLDALQLALDTMDWQPGAQRALVLVTDAPLHDAFDGSGRSTVSLVDLLGELAGQTSVHVIGPEPGISAFVQARWPSAPLVACASGGTRETIAEFLAADAAKSTLVRGLSASVVCTYASADPAAEHTLSVTVRAMVDGQLLEGTATH
ncbi:MAG: VWA domain-containing protein [Deltaproteobacteria bacterium]|nr:VWA domain-containing protein [Deltaproteobacteria bacterium]MCB9786252.1 VWA domain-containing protein [Deltaproteobacteria bacterium]